MLPTKDMIVVRYERANLRRGLSFGQGYARLLNRYCLTYRLLRDVLWPTHVKK